jgi:hypothetical protein
MTICKKRRQEQLYKRINITEINTIELKLKYVFKQIIHSDVHTRLFVIRIEKPKNYS